MLLCRCQNVRLENILRSCCEAKLLGRMLLRQTKLALLAAPGRVKTTDTTAAVAMVTLMVGRSATSYAVRRRQKLTEQKERSEKSKRKKRARNPV